VVLGFPGSAQFVLLSAVVLALFLFHTLALSQAVVLASAGALRSRRWRDIMAVLSPLLALGFYLLFQVVPRYMVKMDWHLMLDNPAWRWVNYLPPGLAARAAGAANQGTWLPALGLLLLLAVITAITVYLAGYLVQLVSVGEGISNQARKRPAAPRQSTPGLAPASLAASRINRWIPPVVAAVAGKEWKYLFRDPLFKANLMQMIYMFVVLIFAFVLPRHTEYGMNLEPIMLWIPAGILLFGGTTLAFNIFGTDGAAAATLFLFPSSRRQIIIGKNLVLSLANMAVNLGLLLLLHILLRSFAHLWQQGVLLVMGAAILTATGNVISVFFPTRMVMRGWRMQQQSAGKGCGRGLMSMLGTFCSTLLMLPVVTAIIVPTFWVHPAWFALSLPLAAGYVIFLYVYSLQITPDILIKREMEIMATMLAEE